MTVNSRAQLGFKNISASKGFTFLTYTFNRLSPCSCIDFIQNRKTNCNSISVKAKIFFILEEDVSLPKKEKGSKKKLTVKKQELKHGLYLR